MLVSQKCSPLYCLLSSWCKAIFITYLNCNNSIENGLWFYPYSIVVYSAFSSQNISFKIWQIMTFIPLPYSAAMIHIHATALMIVLFHLLPNPTLSLFSVIKWVKLTELSFQIFWHLWALSWFRHMASGVLNVECCSLQNLCPVLFSHP